MATPQPATRMPQSMRMTLIAVGVIGLAALLFVFVHSFAKAKPTKSRPVAQVIQIVRPPPPPPDQPPPPPPPPEKVEEVLPRDTPDPSPADDPGPPQLGLDAEGVAGGDAFGLAARRGGADIVGTGSAAAARYMNLVKQVLIDLLAEDESIRRGSYRVRVRVWIDQNGKGRAELSKGTGKRELDAAIERALSRPMRITEPPSLELVQPLNYELVSRG